MSHAAIPFVSTGHLPPAAQVQALLDEAHQRFAANRQGAVSQVYPALARMPADRFGLCVVSTAGNVVTAGDCEVEFAIMSVSKPFVFALLCRLLGAREIGEIIGVNATGQAFNSVAAVEVAGGGRTNPMVNPGAIATTSHVPGADADAKWRFIYDGLCDFAGRRLTLDDEVYASASQTNLRNRSIAELLHSFGALGSDPEPALDLYTRQCSLRVTAVDLAAMGATLADGGVNPVTGEQVIDAESCHATLAVMTTAGLYETSGEWLYNVGLPGKSGIGGGIVTVSPGKGGLGAFAPRLDPAGNSVSGLLAAQFLSRRLGLDLFASQPAARRPQ